MACDNSRSLLVQQDTNARPKEPHPEAALLEIHHLTAKGTILKHVSSFPLHGWKAHFPKMFEGLQKAVGTHLTSPFWSEQAPLEVITEKYLREPWEVGGAQSVDTQILLIHVTFIVVICSKPK